MLTFGGPKGRGKPLHGRAFSLGRAEGSLHGEACSLRRTENPLHVCTSLGCQSLYIYWTHGPQIVHFDNLGSLAQKWLKMAPESSILATWAAWPRNVQNGFQIVLSRLRPISHRKVGWLLAYFQIGCFLLPSRYDFIWKEALEHAPPQNNQPFGIAFLA